MKCIIFLKNDQFSLAFHKDDDFDGDKFYTSTFLPFLTNKIGISNANELFTKYSMYIIKNDKNINDESIKIRDEDNFIENIEDCQTESIYFAIKTVWYISSINIFFLT